MAITIVIKQLPDVFRLRPPPGLDAPHLLVWVLAHAADWHLPSLLVALAAGALIALLRRWPTWPASLIALRRSRMCARRWAACSSRSRVTTLSCAASSRKGGTVAHTVPRREIWSEIWSEIWEGE